MSLLASGHEQFSKNSSHESVKSKILSFSKLRKGRESKLRMGEKKERTRTHLTKTIKTEKVLTMDHELYSHSRSNSKNLPLSTIRLTQLQIKCNRWEARGSRRAEDGVLEGMGVGLFVGEGLMVGPGDGVTAGETVGLEDGPVVVVGLGEQVGN